MKNIDKELIDWAINKIETSYPNDVDLLIGQVGGCKVEADEQNMSFDFFVPATEKGNQLARTFIIEDMGYDLYPISWERLEGIANLNEPRMIFAFDKGEVIYARNQEAAERYCEMKKQMKERLQNKKITFTKALEFIHTSMEIYQTMVFDDSLCHVRKGAGGIAFYLVTAYAFINGMYSRYGSLKLQSEIDRIDVIPKAFTEYYDSIFASNDVKEITNICYQMIKITRDYFIQYVPSSEESNREVFYDDLAEWYQESRYTFRRIEYYCNSKKYEAAFMCGCYIQIEFDAIKDEFCLKELDLMGAYDKLNLDKFKNRSMELEQYIVSVLEANHASMRNYESLEVFLKEQG